MKKYALLFCAILISMISYAQYDDANDIRMVSTYSSENKELSDLLYFQNVDYYTVKFEGKEISSKDYILTVKEMWNGKVRDVDTILNTKMFPNMPRPSKDVLDLKVYGQRTADSKLKLWFRFPNVSITKKYDAVVSDDYSLRDVGIDQSIKYGEKFNPFSYILPYEKDGMKLWCAVDSSGDKIEDWGVKYDLEHYLIFEMEFLK